MNIEQMIEREEGFKSTPYYCTSGYPTVGIGWRIGKKNQSLEDFELIQMCKGTAYAQLGFEISGIKAALSNELEFFEKLSEVRQCVLISMAYQMGVKGLLSFKNMLDAMRAGCWNDAAHEGLDSKWYKQTPHRASRQMKTLLLNDWSEYE